jgi:hypothetical protein
VHHDSWAHFRQDGNDLAVTFKALGLADRLRLLTPGVPTEVVA